jgi:hypothetical protein
MHAINQDVSGGSIMPGQVSEFLGILLASFTLATASRKVKKLR